MSEIVIENSKINKETKPSWFSFLKGKGTQSTLMLMPTVILLIVFGIYPILNILYYSFTDYNGIIKPNFVGLENYFRVFQDKMWWISVKNTFEMGIALSLLQIPISLILAVFLNQGYKGSTFFRAVIFMSCVTSTAVMGVIFFFLFSSHNGIMNTYLINLNIISEPVSWFGSGILSKVVVVIFLLWHDIGLFMILFLAALQKIPLEVYESAKIDGATKFDTFFKITIPLLGSTFKIISVLSLVNALKMFDSVKTLTNGGPGGKTEVMTMYIFRYFFEGQGIAQQGYASALSIVATLIVTFIVLSQYLLSKRKEAKEA